MVHQKERREFHRHDCLMLCRCEGDRFRSHGYIVDISYGGAGKVGTKKLPIEGTKLLVKILLPGKKIELRSRVVWVKSAAKEPGLAEFGVEFLDTLQERQEQLADFFPKYHTIEG
jgi:c-di-GMP-binding flagellar brake protein YcgR